MGDTETGCVIVGFLYLLYSLSSLQHFWHPFSQLLPAIRPLQGGAEAAVSSGQAWRDIGETCVTRKNHLSSVPVPPCWPHALVPLGAPPVSTFALVRCGEVRQLWPPVSPQVEWLIKAQARLSQDVISYIFSSFWVHCDPRTYNLVLAWC